MKKPLVVANWKMYVEKPEVAKKFIATLKRKMRGLAVDVVVAPGFTLIPSVAAAAKGSVVRVAGQSMSPHVDGQHTGEISAAMLKAAGASVVIVGHSERRAAGEDDAAVQAQVELAYKAGFIAIVCVGEIERDPSGAHFSVIAGQLARALGQGKAQVLPKKLIVAYEPVWAIGRSAPLHPADVRETVIFIRKHLADMLGRTEGMRVPILYGGSVEASNAAQLLQEGDIAGFLVGRASADIDSFTELLRVCKK